MVCLCPYADTWLVNGRGVADNLSNRKLNSVDFYKHSTKQIEFEIKFVEGELGKEGKSLSI